MRDTILKLADVLADLGAALLDLSHVLELLAAGGRFDDPGAGDEG